MGNLDEGECERGDSTPLVVSSHAFTDDTPPSRFDSRQSWQGLWSTLTGTVQTNWWEVQMSSETA